MRFNDEGSQGVAPSVGLRRTKDASQCWELFWACGGGLLENTRQCASASQQSLMYNRSLQQQCLNWLLDTDTVNSTWALATLRFGLGGVVLRSAARTSCGDERVGARVTKHRFQRWQMTWFGTGTLQSQRRKSASVEVQLSPHPVSPNMFSGFLKLVVAGLAFTAFPPAPRSRYGVQERGALSVGRIWFLSPLGVCPFFFLVGTCRCGRLLEFCGHRAASAASCVARGASVLTPTTPMQQQDARRLEVVADHPLLARGVQFCGTQLVLQRSESKGRWFFKTRGGGKERTHPEVCEFLSGGS